MNSKIQRHNTIVVGAGQSGLSVGYFLKRQGRDFIILDANKRVGDAWRNRWDSLRLFTPARYDGLAGMPFPAPSGYFPTKDEMADFLESYATHFELPVRTGVRVDRLSRQRDHFVIEAGDLRYEAENVVVAMASFQKPNIPSFAQKLDSGIVQLHSSAYQNPSQLSDGNTLIVGAGNSGAEIAKELAPTHTTWLAGRDTGHVPFRIERAVAKRFLIPLVIRFLYHRVLTIRTPIGRKMRPKILAEGGPLIRTKPSDLDAAGVKRVPRVAGVQGGLPVLEDGRILEVANVIWCTGYRTGFSWIDLPIHGEYEPRHKRGVVAEMPGLYFVGLKFLYSMSSEMIHGVERDARYVADQIAGRTATDMTAQPLESFSQSEAHPA